MWRIIARLNCDFGAHGNPSAHQSTPPSCRIIQVEEVAPSRGRGGGGRRTGGGGGGGGGGKSRSLDPVEIDDDDDDEEHVEEDDDGSEFDVDDEEEDDEESVVGRRGARAKPTKSKSKGKVRMANDKFYFCFLFCFSSVFSDALRVCGRRRCRHCRLLFVRTRSGGRSVDTSPVADVGYSLPRPSLRP